MDFCETNPDVLVAVSGGESNNDMNHTGIYSMDNGVTWKLFDSAPPGVIWIDPEKGAVIAENLDNLYTYIVVELTKANFKNDEGKMEEILGLLNTVRDGWNGISEKNNAKNNMPSAYNGTSPGGTADIPSETMEERKFVIKA